MITNTTHNTKKNQTRESGQALVISAGILFVLAITFMFYMSVQRAYNVANFLDETAELAAQAAAEPVTDDIVNGNVRINETEAVQKAQSTVVLLANVTGAVSRDVILLGDTRQSDHINSEIKVDNITVINPSITGTPYQNAVCGDFNLDPLDFDCRFPLVIVELSVAHRLFGIDFDISTRGVATLGANSRQPEAVPVDLPEPTVLPTNPPIVITVNP